MVCQPAPVKLNRTCRALLAHLAASPPDTSQAALCAQLGVSRMTVSRATNRLVAAGLVYRQRQDAGFGKRLPDHLALSPLGNRALCSRALPRGKHSGAAVALRPGVQRLREGMRAAGLTAGFGNLDPAVEAELDGLVATHGVRKLVAEAKAQTWGLVRHVAAYLARWRTLRAPRPASCAHHPGQPPTGCTECAAVKAAAVPMPEWFKAQRRARRTRLALAGALMSR